MSMMDAGGGKGGEKEAGRGRGGGRKRTLMTIMRQSNQGVTDKSDKEEQGVAMT